MAELILVTARDPQLLLRRAADGFLRRSRPDAGPFPTVDYLLALRQGGVRDDVIALARAAGVPGWFDPPLCIFHELPEWLGQTARVPLNGLARRVLLESLLRQAPGEVFGRLKHPAEFVEALDQWFGELRAEAITPERYSAAAAALPGDAFERQRNAELAELYRGYVAALGVRLRDGRDTLADTAEAVRSAEAELTPKLGGRREIRLFGLHDLRGGWLNLLAALRASPALDRIILFSGYVLPGLVERLGARHEPLERNSALASRLFDVDAEAAGELTVISAPDAERELEEVGGRIRALADGGVPLHEVAIIARRARPHADLAVKALTGQGMPATVRGRRPEREVPVVRAILRLFSAAADRWSRPGLTELAAQPYFTLDLDPVVLNYAGFRTRINGLGDWRPALERVLEQARRRDAEVAEGTDPEAGERRRTLPATDRCERTLAAFPGFEREAAKLDKPRPLQAWLETLRDLIDRDPWGIRPRIHQLPPEEHAVIREDVLGWQRLEQVVEEWRQAIGEWGGDGRAMPAQEFVEALRAALDGDVALWSETAFGVQVLESLAAAYRSFRHVFLVGLEAGQFPMRPPTSPFLDEADREGLVTAGLPLDLRGDWEERERELFRLLVAGGREGLTISYARMSQGQDAIPSTYLESLGDVTTLATAVIPSSRVLTPGRRLVAGPAALAQAEHAARIEALRSMGEPSPWNGVIADPEVVAWLARDFGDDRRWSPTQLEQYAKCPWAFFAQRLLGVERLADPEDGMEPTVRGTILHDALRRFFEGLGASHESPAFLRLADRPALLPRLAGALDAAIASAEGRLWLGHPGLRAAARASLQRILSTYLDGELENNEKYFRSRAANFRRVRLGAAAHEVAFDDVVLELDGVRIRYRGTIDRVERGIDDRRHIAAIDYKTTKYAVPGGGKPKAWGDGVVLQVPLYLHALGQLFPGDLPTAVEYRALKGGESVHQLVLYERDPKSGVITADEEAREKLSAALHHAARHVRRMRAGEFPPAPAPSCKCPTFCAAWHICRTPGGPEADHG